MLTIREWAKDIHELAKAKGWWDDHDGSEIHVAYKLMMVVTELSEAVNDLRTGGTGKYYKGGVSSINTVTGESKTVPKPCGFGVELADAIIRLLDLAEGMGIDIEALMEEKHHFNETRAYKHGKKI